MPRLIRRYIFSTDHKVIGLQYGFTSMFFPLVGFALVMLIRWQQAFPAQPIPLVGGWLGQSNAPGGVLLPEFYNQLGAMHGTIMVFLGVVPLAFGAFGVSGPTSSMSTTWSLSTMTSSSSRLTIPGSTTPCS